MSHTSAMSHGMEEIGEILKKDDHEVEWTIEDFFSYKLEGVCYVSPIFDISGYKWHLFMCPNAIRQNSDVRWISLFLLSGDASSTPLTARYIFGLKKRVGGVVESSNDIVGMFNKDCTFSGVPNFLNWLEVLRRSFELAPLHALTFTCKLKAHKSFESFARLDTLSENLTSMLTSKRGSDVIVRVREEEFLVHKFILSARSPVFAKMLETEMRERNTGVVDIPDCHPEAFEIFIQYLYSGKAEKIPSNMFELYKIAHKYDVEELKTDCVTCILGGLSLDNVLDAVFIGQEFDEDEVKVNSQDLFDKNFGKIVVTKKWESFMKKYWRLANELLKNMAPKIVLKKPAL